MTREEAIEVYNGLINTKIKEAFEFFAPELRESEDERIRIGLIDIFNSALGQDFLQRKAGLDRDKVIAYLEKIKENSLGKYSEEENLAHRLNWVMQDYYKAGKDDEEKEHRFKCYKLFWDALEDEKFFEPKKQKPFDLVEELKLHLANTPKEQLEKEWKELEPYGNIGPTVHEFLYGEQPAEWTEEHCEEDLRTRFAFYTYKDEDGVLYLSNVFVEETSRNKGFGTKILSAAEKVAETIGATTIRLKVASDSPANVWYCNNGYGYMTSEDGYDWLEKNLEYMKPNRQEWSEEDREMIQSIIKNGCVDDKQERWLRMLPERICQPKQEWSEEDELMRKRCIADLGYLTEYEPQYEERYNAQINWLKSLRPQPKPAWSEEDENLFWVFTAYVPNEELERLGVTRLDILKKLKSLRPQHKK